MSRLGAVAFFIVFSYPIAMSIAMLFIFLLEAEHGVSGGIIIGAVMSVWFIIVTIAIFGKDKDNE